MTLLKELSQNAGQKIEEELQDRRDKPLPVNIPDNTGPVATYILERFEEYSDGFDTDREKIDEFLENYVRVVDFEFDDGKGIGGIRSEDDKQLLPKPSKSPKKEDPTERSYNGALKDGNRGVAFLDDADQYIQVLEKIQSKLDDNRTNIRGESAFSIDTAVMAISNPEDYRAELPESTYRRLLEFDMNYLTNYATESELLRKMMGEDWDLLEDEDMDPEDALDVIRRPLETEIMDDEGETEEVTYSPHTLESAAIFEIATRLDAEEAELKHETAKNIPDDASDPLSLMERVQLYQKGYITREYEENGSTYETRLEKEDFNLEDVDSGTAETSINATFTRDVLSAAMTDESSDRGRAEIGDEEIDLSNVVMPYDVLNNMHGRLKTESTIKDKDEVEERLEQVNEHVDSMLEEDVLNAVFHEYRPDTESLEQYVDRVQALRPGEEGTDKFTDSTGDRREPDEFRLKQDEMRFFGFDDEDYQQGGEPSEKVREFRRDISNKIAVRARNGGFDNAEGLTPIQDRLGTESWEDIRNIRGGEFESFEVSEWMDQSIKPKDAEDFETDTQEIKNTAIWNMVEHQDYNPATAVLTTREVISNLQN